MADNIKIDIRGLPELKTLLEELPKRSINKGFRKGLSRAATPILSAAKRLCPRDTGLLKKSLKKKLKTYQNGTVICLIGPDRSVSTTKTTKKGKERKYRPANIAHAVDQGHGGPRPAPAHQFMKPAYDQNQSGAIATAETVMIETLNAEAERLGFKG